MLTINYNDPDLTPDGVDIGGGEKYNYQNAPFTGALQFSYPNGSLQTEITYVNGYVEGVCREYYSNGQMMQESYIKYNLDYGLFRQWDENGNLIDQFDFGPGPRGIK